MENNSFSEVEIVILAGGFGTRLKNTIGTKPKCLAPINGEPFLAYLLQFLSVQNARKVKLSLGYEAGQVIAFIEHLKSLSLELSYVVEPAPLGTGGGLRLAMEAGDTDNVIVMNGDTFIELDLNEFWRQHLQSTLPVSMALKMMNHFERYGSVSLNEEGLITNFQEKKYCESGLINAGVYCINRKHFLEATTEGSFSLEEEFLKPAASMGLVKGQLTKSYFIDIGVPEDYAKAQHVVALKKYSPTNL